MHSNCGLTSVQKLKSKTRWCIRQPNDVEFIASRCHSLSLILFIWAVFDVSYMSYTVLLLMYHIRYEWQYWPTCLALKFNKCNHAYLTCITVCTCITLYGTMLLRVQVLVTGCVPLECLVCATVYCQLISFAVVVQIDICEHWVFTALC